MTLVAGLIATDGIVMAADSQATDLEAQIRTSTPEKLAVLGTHIVWGFSGAVGLKQLLRPALEAAHAADWRRRPCADLRVPIGSCIAAVRRDVVGNMLVSNHIPGAEALFAGVTGAPGQAKPWLVEYPSDNVAEEHFKFCAVGSGKKAGYHAFETLRHYAPQERPVALAKLFLYRIMEDAIRAESQGIGGDIHLWSVTTDGAHEEATSEVQGLAQLVDQWKRNERESLRDLMNPGGSDSLATTASVSELEGQSQA